MRFISLLMLFTVMFYGCNKTKQTDPIDFQDELNWETHLESQIKLLGHRNWIVVADAAYPLQSNAGILTILSNDDHLTTIKKVNEIIDRQNHIKPNTFLDKEIDFITDSYVPGMQTFRDELANLLGTDANKVIHEEIISMLDEASEVFNVIIIKTDFAIPYTSVFFQLDCKYWNAEAEQKLRKAITYNK